MPPRSSIHVRVRVAVGLSGDTLVIGYNSVSRPTPTLTLTSTSDLISSISPFGGEYSGEFVDCSRIQRSTFNVQRLIVNSRAAAAVVALTVYVGIQVDVDGQTSAPRGLEGTHWQAR